MINYYPKIFDLCHGFDITYVVVIEIFYMCKHDEIP